MIKQREKLQQIYDQHTSIVPDSQHGFWFKGKRYGETTDRYPRFKPLAEQLHESMNSYLNTYKQLDKEQSYISSYLTHAMNLCQDKGILYSLIPKDLHRVLDNQGYTNTYQTLPDDLLKELLSQNQKGHDYIYTRLLDNITG